jgi:hypothetical protein
MSFQIYDYDQDHYITSLDMYAFLKNYEHDEDCFLKAFAGDLALIEKAIEEKKVKLGLSNGEVKFKLREIDNKLKQIGGRLEVKLLEDFNPKEDLDFLSDS